MNPAEWELLRKREKQARWVKSVGAVMMVVLTVLACAALLFGNIALGWTIAVFAVATAVISHSEYELVVITGIEDEI